MADALRTELTTDPLARGYATMTDEEVLTSLTTENRTRARLVPVIEITKYLRENNLWLQIKAAAATNAGAAAAVDYNSDVRTETLDVNLSIVATMLSALVTDNLLTQDQSDAIVAMGTETVSRATELGLGRLKIGYIKDARN